MNVQRAFVKNVNLWDIALHFAAAQQNWSWNQNYMFLCALSPLWVQLFKGKFFYCDGLNVSNITNKTECLEAGYHWIRRKYNFDNLGQVCYTSTHLCFDICKWKTDGTDFHSPHSSRHWCRSSCCLVRTAGWALCTTAWTLLGWTSRWGEHWLMQRHSGVFDS